MHGYWIRLTPDELADFESNPDWMLDEEVAEEKTFCTDKAWHALDFLLTRQGFPVDIVFGERAVEQADDESDDGPSRYLTPDRVRVAAEALAPMTEESLARGVSLADLEREQIYPNVWDEPDFNWVTDFLPEVKVWFQEAAESGDAMICWVA